MVQDLCRTHPTEKKKTRELMRNEPAKKKKYQILSKAKIT
jgi:hypothetical protein